MDYPTLLVHLDGASRGEACVEFAGMLARRLGSHLTGVATGLDGLEAASRDDHGQSLLLRRRHRAEAAVSRFRTRMRDIGLEGCEAVVELGDDTEALLQRGRCSDLVILGQSDPDAPGHAQARTRVDRLVLHGAPPTLVVPYIGQQQDLTRHVLIAWSDTGPAARAASAALPLLRRADAVTLLHCEAPMPENTGSAARLGEVVRWLARHGVVAQAAVEPDGTEIGETILSRAADLSAGLIVMGAWSHSRLAENLLGGVTRTLLDEMTVPVLLAH
jgi:nucleotide-binding universal stress UspA family protein